MHQYSGNWLQSAVQSCIMPRLPKHLVQELSVDAAVFNLCDGYLICWFPDPSQIYKVGREVIKNKVDLKK